MREYTSGGKPGCLDSLVVRSSWTNAWAGGDGEREGDEWEKWMGLRMLMWILTVYAPATQPVFGHRRAVQNPKEEVNVRSVPLY